MNNSNNKISIIPGLTGMIDIKIGERSVLDYFLELITKGLDNSLNEK